jgi:hypothetical protein
MKRPITNTPNTWDEVDVAARIARDDPEALLYIPIWVSMDPPGRIWAERLCVRLSSHPDANVRANSILGFGHLARIYRRSRVFRVAQRSAWFVPAEP